MAVQRIIDGKVGLILPLSPLAATERFHLPSASL